MSGKKSKLVVKPVPVIIAAVIVILIIAAVTINVVKASKNKKEDNSAQITFNQTDLKNEDVTVPVTEKTTVEILMDDTAAQIGTVFQATALVSPANTAKALVWSSSNENVFKVDKDGVVTITGKGTAALTATIGDVSDAVAIEGIENIASGSVNNYPVITSSGNIIKNTSSAGNTVSSGNSGSQGNAGNSGASGSSYNNGSSGNQGSSGNGSSGDNSGNSADSGNNSSNSGNSGNNGNNGNNGNAGDNSSSGNNTDSGNTGNNSQNTSDTGNSGGTGSDDISQILPGNGFEQIMSNVYVCNDNGTYCGEIITQPNVTIIYIKQRSSGFDAKIQTVLSELLSSESSQVWNNYVSATSDRTFTVSGRKVRIVTAAGGGHSQIVIYN